MGGAEVVSTEPAAALMWGISAGGLLEPALRGQELTEATWGCFHSGIFIKAMGKLEGPRDGPGWD